MALFSLTACKAQEQDSVLDIKEVKSKSGITAWLVEDPSVPVIAIRFVFKNSGAALDPPDKQGLARMVSNTLDEGAGDLDSQAFQKELRDLSVTLSFNSVRNGLTGTLKTLTSNKDRAFELLTLSLTQPRFDEEPVERMRAANLSRIRSDLTDPDWIAARMINDLAFAGHPYAQNSGGTLTTLNNITPDDLRQFAQNNLTRDRLFIGVAGDITEEELAAQIDRIFGDLPEQGPDPAIEDHTVQNHGTVALYEKDIPQTIVEIIQPGIARTDPDYHIAQIMNFTLGGSGFGSRLTEEIREKRGLTYGIYSYFILMNHLSAYAVSTSTKNENVKEMLALIETEWNRMRGQPITDEELENARTYLIGSLPLSLTSTDKIAALLLSIQVDGLPVDYLERREKAIRNASKEDVQRVARRILDTSKFTTVLVGRPEGIEATKIIETLPNVE